MLQKSIKDFQRYILRVSEVNEIHEFVGEDLVRLRFIEKLYDLAGRDRKTKDYGPADIYESTLLSEDEWVTLDSQLRTLLNRLH